jgi:O-antigen/teichoic acid export membrane protein
MGAYIALTGTVITIVFNLLLVPEIGYKGAAYGQLACYASMVIISFFVGRKYYKVHYPVKWIAFYSALALVFYWISTHVQNQEDLIKFSFNTLLIIVFIAIAFFLERKKIQQFSV